MKKKEKTLEKEHWIEENRKKEGKMTENGTKEVSDKKRRRKAEATLFSSTATDSLLIPSLCKSSFIFQQLVKTMIKLPCIRFIFVR